MKEYEQYDSIWNNQNPTKKCVFGFTRLEFCLLLFSLILLCLLIGISVLWLFVYQGFQQIAEGRLYPSNGERDLFKDSEFASIGNDRSALHHKGYVCTSRECVQISGFLGSNLNDKVNPCDDFYEYACGNYATDRYLPSSKSVRHTLSDMQNRLNKQIRKLLEASTTKTDRPWDCLAKQYYQKCLNEENLKATGVHSMIKVLKDLGGWPVLEGYSWKPWSHSWEKQLARIITRTGANAIILELAVSHDPLNSSRNIIELDQPKWGIGSRWPYLAGLNDPVIQNYTSLMIQTAMNIVKGAPRTHAEREMRQAIEFELRLVNFSADETTRRDPERGNNRFQLWQLRDSFPQINLVNYVREVFSGLEELSPNDTIIIREPEYFRRLQEVMPRYSKRVVANYMLWRVVQGYSPFFPLELREPFYAFKANQTGIPTNVPVPDRWEDCVFLTIVLIDMPVGRLYVENYFDRFRTMKKMNDITKHIKNEFIRQLKTVDWMDERTRRQAIIKAEHIEYKNGFPPYIFNETYMLDNWAPPETTDDESLLEFTIRIKLARVIEEFVRLKKSVDRSIWFQSPAQVDAYYAPNLNEMIFPAGIMQFPFMSPGVPNYITYAMAGAVVGHEVSHAFDDQGGRYDEYGNLHNWWDSRTADKFYEKTECFIKQYSAVEVKEVGIHLNGRLSVGENIADNAGIKIAFMAYKSWLNKETHQEVALPGFQNMTNTQMFFLAYANNWCSMIKPKHYLQIIMTDVHAPSKYRAILPLQNRPEFAEAFHCPLGSPMNPMKKCSIW